MIVVSDTTPINYLVLIEQAEALHLLYGRVIIPQAVFDELQRERTPLEVKEWLAHRPAWLEVQQASVLVDAALEHLDDGEREAIILAEEARTDAIIMDERAGVREALRRNLRVIGTLGVLDEAAERGLLNLPEALERLERTCFRAPPTLLRALLESDAKRRFRQAIDKVPDVEPDEQDRLE
jgi:predicted nucleic acid-binding protein